MNFKVISTIVLLLLVSNVHSQTLNDTIAKRLSSYKSVKLTADLSAFSDQEKEGIRMLIRAARAIDQIFWVQSYGDPNLLNTVTDTTTAKFMALNYGPWDRLNDFQPFVKGVGPKPKGANFYPKDMRKGEFDSLEDVNKKSPYTVIVRNREGKLEVIPYNFYYEHYLNQAITSLFAASTMFRDDTAFSKYLMLRGRAMRMNDFDASDRAWLDLKDNRLDIIIGPIENYEDQLYGIKTAYESYVLVKDMEWSKRLEKYVKYLPELQKGLPVDKKYKAENAGSSSQLNAYDVIYYAGDCNAGSKTIAVNLPNDETLQVEKGTRRSQLKNAIKAKYDYIMKPIADELIDTNQLKHITFDAFFSTIMFHEVAHGLGIKNTINGKGTVRDALGANYSALEEGKADILGLYMITQLHDKKVLKEGQLMDYYVTFMAGIFRSVRFGAGSAHGKANMIRFNFFKEKGAFTRNETTGRYSINFEKMKLAMTELSALILQLQGDGDAQGVQKLVDEKGKIMPELQRDLDRLSAKNIPVDLVFEQGEEVLGLNNR
ncbi:MAG: Zn-dependent hydrolase [Bacteroidota bacterium]